MSNLGSKELQTEEGSNLIFTQYGEEVEIILQQHTGREAMANLNINEIIKMIGLLEYYLHIMESEERDILSE